MEVDNYVRGNAGHAALTEREVETAKTEGRATLSVWVFDCTGTVHLLGEVHYYNYRSLL